MKQPKPDTPATEQEIRQILGSSCNSDLVTLVRSTGASYDEVLQAYEWMANDDYMGRKKGKPASGVVGRVCDILQEDMGEE